MRFALPLSPLVLLACTGKDSPPGDTETGTLDTDTGPVVVDDTGESGETDEPEDTAAELAAYQSLYDLDEVQVITLRLDEAAIAALEADPDTYVSGGFEHAGNVFGKVGIKVRGGQTFAQKPGFQVKFQEFGGEEYVGVERLLLDNQWDDSAVIRAPLAYEAWRDAGLVAPLCNYAEVYVNDEYYGVYANIEAVDEKFVSHHYADATGDLYEGKGGADFYEQGVTFFDLLDGEGDEYAMQIAWEAVQPPYEAGFYADAQAAIDMAEYFRYFAWLLATGSNEGYPFEQNDFYVYLEPTVGLFQFLPWGLDQAWDNSWTAEANRGFLDVYCEADATCTKALRMSVATELSALEVQNLGDRAGELFLLTEDAVSRDTRAQFPASQVSSARSAFVSTLDGWPARVRTALGM